MKTGPVRGKEKRTGEGEKYGKKDKLERNGEDKNRGGEEKQGAKKLNKKHKAN
jgi:hypothetical protein